MQVGVTGTSRAHWGPKGENTVGNKESEQAHTPSKYNGLVSQHTLLPAVTVASAMAEDVVMFVVVHVCAGGSFYLSCEK